MVCGRQERGLGVLRARTTRASCSVVAQVYWAFSYNLDVIDRFVTVPYGYVSAKRLKFRQRGKTHCRCRGTPCSTKKVGFGYDDSKQRVPEHGRLKKEATQKVSHSGSANVPQNAPGQNCSSRWPPPEVKSLLGAILEALGNTRGASLLRFSAVFGNRSEPLQPAEQRLRHSRPTQDPL